jgi:rod shape-determining protein MreD
MRTTWLVAALLAVAVVVQVSVLNGLLLPGGGVPDLVLVLVCALAMASGPVNGVVIGFAAGLSLDLAPPGSALVGQYALIFCLAGWAAGRLRPVAGQTAWHPAGLVATGLLALVVAGGEALSAAVAKVLTPSAVTLSQLRLVLPSTIAYDVILCPVALSAVMLAATMLARRSVNAEMTRTLARPRGSLGFAPLGGTARSRRAAKRAGQLPELHLARNTRPATPHAVPRQRSQTRLRPAAGVPGSATGMRFVRSRPTAPVHLRLADGRRGDGVLGAGLAGARPGTTGPGRHPGMLAGGRAFRPHVDRPAVPHQAQRRPVEISFAGHRGDGSFGQAFAAGRAARTPPHAMSFAGHRGDGSFGQTLAAGRPAPWRPRQPAIHFGPDATLSSSSGPQLRVGARRSSIATSAVPRLRFANNPVPVQRRTPAVPRFRRGPSGRNTLAIVAGGVLSDAAFRARRQQAAPRLRLSRVPPGMLGGSGRSMLARPPGRSGKQPRFSYGKRSPLSVLTRSRVGRRLGGRWLARQRAGGRSGVWLLGRRTGGSR